ncbi:MAG: hypothetical protein WCQ21_06335, partial [Verrucomicrobiota bacterium]
TSIPAQFCMAFLFWDWLYIGERFGENSVGGKWLMGWMLRMSLTLLGRGKGAVEGLNYFAELL